MKKIVLILPFAITIFLFSILLFYLIQEKDSQKPPSAFINKDVPSFSTKNLLEKDFLITNDNIKNKIVLINFFASWCIPCKAEHSVLINIKKKYPNLILLGINYKDIKEDAINFLSSNGNPYDFVGTDNTGDIGFEFGVFGLPETYLVNKKSIIIYKHAGALTETIVKNEIIPKL